MEEQKKFRRIPLYLPLILAVTLIIGIFLGIKITPPEMPTIIFPSKSFSDINKMNEILNYVEDAYVDTVNKKLLVENSIEEMLQSLDPHSYYIPSSEFEDVTDPLEGNFEGIGIEFRIVRDSVVVVNALGGGPSEKAGILAGDRIISVNDSVISGVGITNSGVMELLKGKKGTPVQLTIKRRGTDKLLDFQLVRGKIPIFSVEAAYMIDDDIGYVKVSRFGRTTYNEFVEQTEKLKEKGLRKLILDLRNNGGGYLHAATKIADELLAKKELIVYTEGRSRSRQSVYATPKGSLSNTAVYILINENSASASEILAGAIQDNDRGLIIGRRSFGKGLVQEQLELPDGSAVRLTVARYYTPTGRSIQKPYGESIEDYRLESYLRYQSGEMYSIDSIQFPDSLQYTTPGGKVVYGGGGIMPDVFIPVKPVLRSEYLSQLQQAGVFVQFGFNYSDLHRSAIEKYDSFKAFDRSFNVSNNLINEFVRFAAEQGVPPNYKEVKNLKEILKSLIKANIAQNFWGIEGYISIINQTDETVRETIQLIRSGKADSLL